MSGPDHLRVLIAEDDDRYAWALTELLAAAGFAVVGRAANGAEAVALATHLRPDAVTMDLQMPLMDGVEATRQIAPLGIPVVIVSASEYALVAHDAVTAGAAANISKGEAPELLSRVIREVASGRPSGRLPDDADGGDRVPPPSAVGR
jgi:DNA-binding NarL/FixJ family response regulator